MEDAFSEEIKSRGETFKYFMDQYGEHPEERAVKNVELDEKLQNVDTLTKIFGSLKEKVTKAFVYGNFEISDKTFS